MATKHARLPSALVDEGQNQIRGMRVGDEGYVPPWCLHAGADGRLYLQGTFELSDTRRGTMEMYVQRTADGWAVGVPPRHRWPLESWDVPPYQHAVPVARVIGYENEEKSEPIRSDS